MLKNIAFSITALFSASVFAQGNATVQNLSVVCSDPVTIGKLVKEFDEVPRSAGVSTRDLPNNKTAQNPIILFVNPKTGSWTLVERVNAENYCIVAVGDQYKELKKAETY